MLQQRQPIQLISKKAMILTQEKKVINSEQVIEAAAACSKRLLAAKLVFATAESCTGGWVAQAVTSIPGSSDWFDCGFVTYSNLAKQRMLGVKAETLATYGAVSEATAIEMAEGALANSIADLSVAITGIAGPDGGSKAKPVGTVWFAFGKRGAITRTSLQHFSGDRQAIRAQAVIYALENL